MPAISVIMSAYNDAQHLPESIESILNQTNNDLEFIIIDDGSTDATPQILRDYQRSDNRIYVISQPNAGLTRSLIRATELAGAPYIARMDADDISEPERLEVESKYLDTHPECGLVGVRSWVIDETGILLGSRQIDANNLQQLLQKRNPFHHGEVMFRRKCIDTVGTYRALFRYAQDYDLWLRIAEHFGIALIDRHLYRWRLSASGVTMARRRQQSRYQALARKFALQRHAGGFDDYDDFCKSPAGQQLAEETPQATKSGVSTYHRIKGGFLLQSGKPKHARTAFEQAIFSQPFRLTNYALWATTYLGKPTQQWLLNIRKHIGYTR